jgi:hypothetical protein
MSMPQAKLPNIKAASLDLPAFIKLVYLLIGSGALAWFLFQIRQGGSLAAAAENASLGLVYALGGLIIVFGIIVIGSSLRKR